MKINLISLVLKNFKGIQNFEFVPDGKNTAVFGTNASGKTTLADAYYWLLFGNDSTGSANFDVKTIGTSGLDYGVEGVIEVDGEKHTLKRVLNEKWERRRGDTEKKLKGNTTTYSIDGQPATLELGNGLIVIYNKFGKDKCTLGKLKKNLLLDDGLVISGTVLITALDKNNTEMNIRQIQQARTWLLQHTI